MGFECWGEVCFRVVNQKTLQKLRDTLHYRGIYTGHEGALQTLVTIIQLPCPSDDRMPDPPSWPQDEFMATAFDRQSKAHEKQPKLLAEKKITKKISKPNPTPKKPSTNKTATKSAKPTKKPIDGCNWRRQLCHTHLRSREKKLPRLTTYLLETIGTLERMKATLRKMISATTAGRTSQPTIATASLPTMETTTIGTNQSEGFISKR